MRCCCFSSGYMAHPKPNARISQTVPEWPQSSTDRQSWCSHQDSLTFSGNVDLSVWKPVVLCLKVNHLGLREGVCSWNKWRWFLSGKKERQSGCQLPIHWHSVGGFKSSFVGVFKPQQFGNDMNKIYRERQSGWTQHPSGLVTPLHV